MNLTIDAIRPGLYSLTLSLDHDYKTVVDCLNSEHWQPHTDRKDDAGLAGTPYAERSGLLNPKNKVLTDIMDFINSDMVKEQLVNFLYDTQGDYISSLWEGWSKEQMLRYTFWGCMFNRDRPGFHIPLHLDTRLQIVTAMVYFVEKDDPNQSTVYYTSNEYDDPLRISSKFGNGVLHINDHTAWHEGYNRSNVTRYSLICGLLLKVKE
jgi:hypothetical protein